MEPKDEEKSFGSKVVRFFKGKKVKETGNATIGNGSPNTTEFDFPGDKKPEESEPRGDEQRLESKEPKESGASDETTPITKAKSGEQPPAGDTTLPVETPPSSEVKVNAEVQVTPPSQPTQPAEPAAPGEEKQPTTPKKQGTTKTKQKQATATSPLSIEQLSKEIIWTVDMTQENKEQMLKDPILKFLKQCEKICGQMNNNFAQILSLIVKRIKKINANILSVSAEIQQAQKDAEKKFDATLNDLKEAIKILS